MTITTMPTGADLDATAAVVTALVKVHGFTPATYTVPSGYRFGDCGSCEWLVARPGTIEWHVTIPGATVDEYALTCPECAIGFSSWVLEVCGDPAKTTIEYATLERPAGVTAQRAPAAA